MININKKLSWLFGGALISAACNSYAASSVTPVFSTDTIGPGASSPLVMTLNNGSGTSDRNISFTAPLPAGVTISDPVIASSDCGIDSQVTATAGGTSFSLSNGSLATGSVCSVTVWTTSSTPGTHTFTMPSITIGSDTTSSANDDLVVNTSRPGVSFSFASGTAVVGENIRATLTFDNSLNGSLASSLTASFALPDGLEISDFPDTTNTCDANVFTGGSVGAPGDSTFSLSFGGGLDVAAVDAGATCSVSQNLKAKKPVSGTVASSLINYQMGALGYAADDIVISQPALIMDVLSPVSPGQSTQLQFTITNFERSSSASDIDFSVDLDALTPSSIAGISWTSSAVNNVCGNGDLSGSGSSLITFSNGSLGAEQSCTFSVDVNVPLGTTPGSYKVNSSTVLIDSVSKGTATTDLVVVGAPTAALRFTQSGDSVSSVAAGSTVGVEFTFSDTSNSSVTDLQALLELTGGLPFPISAALPPTPNPPCGAGSSLSLVFIDSDRQGLQLTGGNLAANGSCTFTADVTIPSGLETSVLNYTMTSASATVNAQTVNPKLPSFSITVVGAPSLKVDMPKGVLGGDSANAVFTLSHRDISSAAASNIGFTLDLNSVLSGLTASNLPLSGVCGSGSSLTGSAGDSFVTLTGASLSPDSSCNFNLALNIPNGVTPGEFNATTSNVTATVDGLNVTGKSASSDLVVAGLEGTLEFLSSAIPGSTVTARYSFNNVGPTDATSIVFTHNLSELISGTVYTGGDLSNVCGSGSALTGTTLLILTGGNLQSGQNCSFDLEITIPGGAALGSYNAITSSVTYSVGSSVSIDALVAQLKVDVPLEVTAKFTSDFVNDNSAATLEYTLMNSGSQPITNIAFTEDFNSALSGSSANIGSATQCGGALSGSSTLSFSGGSLAVGASCTLTVGVDMPNVNSQTIFSSSTSSITGTSNSIAFSVDPVSTTIKVIDSAQDIVTTIGVPSLTLTNTGPVSFPITFTNAEEVNLTVSDVLLTTTGTASASVSVNNGTTTTPEIVLSNISGDGTLAFSIKASVARNSAGSSIASLSSQSINVDNVKPVITMTSSQNGNTLNNSVPFVVTIYFATDLDTLSVSKSDLTLVNASVSDFSVTDGNSANITFNALADGPVSITLPANQVRDSAGNGNDVQTVNFISDNKKPVVTISTNKVANNGSFSASINFSEVVTGFDVNDIVVGNAALSGFSGAGSDYSVTVTPGVEGTVTLDVAENVATDNANNGNLASSQLSVEYDITLPTVVITAPSTTQTSDFSISVAFSEIVSGFDIGDVNATNAVLSNFTDNGSGSYSIDVTPSSDGIVLIDILAGVASDAAGNNNTAAEQKSVSFDGSRPTVAISGPTLVGGAKFDIQIAFSEPVTGFESSDISVSNASVVSLDGSGSNYTATIVPSTGNSVTISIPENSALDSNGNTNQASNQLDIAIDDTKVRVTINAPEKAKSTFTTTIDFTDSVTGFDISDIQVVNGQLSNFVALSGSSYSVDVTGSQSLQITLFIPEDVVLDQLGNGNVESLEVLVSYDGLAPKVENLVPVNNSDSIPITTSFSIGFDESIELGSGKIKLIDIDNGDTVEASQRTILGNTIEFSFGADLKVETRYQVLVEQGAVQDTIGNTALEITNWFFITSNTAPLANDDSVIVNEDSVATINVVENDTDAEGELDLSSIELNQPRNGSAVVNNSGGVIYTPNSNYFGNDSFSYSIADKAGLRSNLAEVVITVENVNDAPKFDSQPNTVAVGEELYSYDVKISDIDSESTSVRALTKPDWIELNGTKLTGTPSSELIGQSFPIVLETSDGELTQQQAFSVEVNAFDNSKLIVSQEISVSPILVGDAFLLTLEIANNSSQSIFIDALSIDIEGVTIEQVTNECSVSDASINCQIPQSLEPNAKEIVLVTLSANSAGEFVSTATLDFNSGYTKNNKLAKAITESKSDEVGASIDITDVNSFALGDMNNDDLIDIIYAGNKTSSIYLNQGAGQYILGANVLSSENVLDVEISDLDGDGNNDIIFATESEFGSGVWFNSGDLSVASIQILSKLPSKAVFVFDITGDEVEDVVFLDNSQPGVSIFAQPFEPLIQSTNRSVQFTLGEQFQINDLTSADLNGDGLVDMILAISDKPLELWIQTEVGEFEKQQSSISNVQRVLTAELLESGILNIVTLSQDGVRVLDNSGIEIESLSSIEYIDISIDNLLGDEANEILLLAESGDITYLEHMENGYKLSPTVFTSEGASKFKVADVDLDGDLDIVSISKYGRSHIRYNQGSGRFGLQTTDLNLTTSNSSLNAIEGNSEEISIVISNNGLSQAEMFELNIAAIGNTVSIINSGIVTCEENSTGHLCKGNEPLTKGESANIQVTVMFNQVGDGSINLSVTSNRVDDNSEDNVVEISTKTTAKPIIIEPPKKKSSGTILWLLLFTAIILLLQARTKVTRKNT